MGLAYVVAAGTAAFISPVPAYAQSAYASYILESTGETNCPAFVPGVGGRVWYASVGEAAACIGGALHLDWIPAGIEHAAPGIWRYWVTSVEPPYTSAFVEIDGTSQSAPSRALNKGSPRGSATTARPAEIPDPCANGGPSPIKSNPINCGIGNKYQRELDYRGDGPMPLVWERSYNSLPQLNAARALRSGTRWNAGYERYVDLQTLPGYAGSPPFVFAVVMRPDGKELFFEPDGTGWRPSLYVSEKLERVLDGSGNPTGWRYTTVADEVETYDAAGRLVSIANRAGLTQTMAYDVLGRLATVTDAFGRSLTLAYDANGRVETVTDPASGIFRYAYAANGNLQSVTYPDLRVRTYVYEDAANPFALTGIVDENNSRFATWAYDGPLPISGEHAGGVDRVSITYNIPIYAYVTDAFGVRRTYRFDTAQGAANVYLIEDGGPCAICGPVREATYDTNALLTSRADWNGNRSCYKLDTARNLELARAEGLAGACPADVATWTPAPSTVERKLSTQWHPTLRLPTKICAPGRMTTLVYDAQGNVTTRTVQATTDPQGAQGCSATPVGTARTWAYTYNANGQMLTVDGPRTDVSDATTYNYYPNDDPDLGKRGNVATITNALGHVTQITSYNAHGQPLTIVDPNGLTTQLAYDSRQRLTSRNVGGELTSYEFDGVGQLTRVTLPDGSFLTYTFDAAHRLTAIADSLGNRIAYTLDLMGNRTREDVFDPSNALAQTRSRVYNALNRLEQEIGGTSPATQVTRYGFDNQGNVTAITDPLNRVTANAFDALNRLAQMTDPASGVTRYGYNGLDQLTSVTDPRNNATAYTMDGLGNLTQQVSPDTGTTTNTQDAAGNVLTTTDAKGQTTTSSFDALNRVTRIVYNAATGTQLKQVDFGYDLGTSGIGRLTSITETSAAGSVLATIQVGFDAKGRVTSEARTMGAATATTAYSFDAAGRLTGMTYPSGRTTSYQFDALGRVSRIETSGGGTSQVVLQDAAYQPFGSVKGFTFGNLQPYARTFDLDGRISAHSLANQTKSLSFDAASRITRIEQQGTPANFADYGYDTLDRLTSTILPASTFGFGYDPVGNRLTKSTTSGTDTYAISPTSNQLASISGSTSRAYTHDANGSITSDGLNGFSFDARGRLVASTSAIGATTYQVNALGQRVRKTSSLGDVVFHYDTQGRLIAEASPAGTPIREYVWLGDQPVAVLVAQVAPGTEAIIDNADAGFSATGTWPASTAVSGYLGANYLTHEANGAPPGALVVDNTDAGFSVTGTWTASTAVPGYLGTNYQHHTANGEPPGAIVADNGSGSATGTWPTSTSVTGYYGTNYQVHAAGTGANVFTWSLAAPASGTYEVYARWTQHPNRATNAKYTVNHAGGATVVTVNQESAGGQWVPLGTFSFNAGPASISLSDEANENVIADAVMLVPPGAAPNTASWTVAVPSSGSYQVYARWTAHPNRATDAKYTVNHAGGATVVTANQEQASGQWNLLGTFGFNAGAATVKLTDQANGYVIADAVMFLPPGAAPSSATWTPNVAAAGQYQVYARWTAHANRASNATYTVTHAGGATPVTVNQQLNGGSWQLLGTYTLAPGTAHKVTLTDQANGYVIADAVRVVPLAGQQSGSTIYYVHADHLNTPRAVTNQSQQPVWRWENQEPFGNNPPEENPSGIGNFEFNLRFPGQYFDKETGLHYNYFRDYDPQAGRYVQSDPIGLRGGINLYLYAIDPLTQIDPMGLMGRGSGVPSRPQQPWPREMNDFGPCAYYDQKCQDTGCFYYCYSAPAVCRNAQSAPAPYSFYGPSKLNCVRRCLVREDQKIRGAACDGKRCLPDKDIDDYHQTCFTECGVPPILYPGVNPWWFFNLNPQ